MPRLLRCARYDSYAVRLRATGSDAAAWPELNGLGPNEEAGFRDMCFEAHGLLDVMTWLGSVLRCGRRHSKHVL